MSAPSLVDPCDRVTVVAPARLHLGFLDPGGALGRKFGSLGVGINEIATRLTLVRSDRLTAEGPGAERAVLAVAKLSRALGNQLPVAIRIDAAIPDHAGLGSGTQLDLAVGTGVSCLYGLGLDARRIASIVERGARSGIGIAVFEGGGLVVDGGRGAHTLVPPMIARLEMPPEWRLILVLDEGGQGLHGRREVEAFRNLPVFPAEEAAHLCHLLLMKGLPAVVERDLRSFGAVITELQCSVGDYFGPAQGGRFTSPEVGEVLAFLEDLGAVGIGQSSWGPTGFCLVGDLRRAAALLNEVRQTCRGLESLRFLIGSARNHGAEIVVESGHASGRPRSDL